MAHCRPTMAHALLHASLRQAVRRSLAQRLTTDTRAAPRAGTRRRAPKSSQARIVPQALLQRAGRKLRPRRPAASRGLGQLVRLVHAGVRQPSCTCVL
eukprot:1152184-Prymnesium_polylepis.2